MYQAWEIFKVLWMQKKSVSTMINSRPNMGALAFQKPIDTRSMEKYKMNTYIKRHRQRELQTVNHPERNPQFQQNFLLLSHYEIFKHPLSKFIQHTYRTLELVSPFGKSGTFCQCFLSIFITFDSYAREDILGKYLPLVLVCCFKFK